ncbi:MAG: hypothetical protein WC712_13435 [Candidatus Brocadiia bacterium]
MNSKLSDYFALVTKSRSATESQDVTSLRNRMREVSKSIRKLSSQVADPSANFSEIMGKISGLKEEQRGILDKLSQFGSVDKVSLKRKILENRMDLLNSPYRDGWHDVVDFFKKNPVALTALIHQTGYEDLDRVQVLRTLPFRGRVSGPYGARYYYTVRMADGTDRPYPSVRKIIVTLDQYNRDFRSLALTFDVLSRMIMRGLTINGMRIASISRRVKE